MYKLYIENCNLLKTKKIAEKLAINSVKGDIFLFQGELGSGKTTFIRFLINKIFFINSLKKPKFIKSPSFPIMINYELKDYEIYHYDFYRIKNEEEFIELNIYENIINNLTFIEWPEIIIKKGNFKNYFLINIEIINSNKRKIEISHTHKKYLK